MGDRLVPVSRDFREPHDDRPTRWRYADADRLPSHRPHARLLAWWAIWWPLVVMWLAVVVVAVWR